MFIGTMLNLILATAMAGSGVAPPSSEQPVAVLERTMDALDLQPTPCRSQIREEWSEYHVVCARFEGPLCDCNARWVDYMLDHGLKPVATWMTLERFFPERRDQFFDVGKIFYAIDGYPVLVLTHEYDSRLLVAVSDSTAEQWSSLQEGEALLPRLHPVEGVDMLTGPLLSGSPTYDSHARLLDDRVEIEDPRTPTDRHTAVSLTLLINVDMHGDVGSAHVQEHDADEELARAAVSAAERWKFTPARFCGLPWPDVRLVSVEFPAAGQ